MFSDYEDTPYLTALVSLCSMLGVFVGVWALILLIGDWHRGIAAYWPLLVILGADLLANAAARTARARRRRGLSRERSERQEHLLTR